MDEQLNDSLAWVQRQSQPFSQANVNFSFIATCDVREKKKHKTKQKKNLKKSQQQTTRHAFSPYKVGLPTFD